MLLQPFGASWFESTYHLLVTAEGSDLLHSPQLRAHMWFHRFLDISGFHTGVIHGMLLGAQRIPTRALNIRVRTVARRVKEWTSDAISWHMRNARQYIKPPRGSFDLAVLEETIVTDPVRVVEAYFLGSDGGIEGWTWCLATRSHY